MVTRFVALEVFLVKVPPNAEGKRKYFGYDRSWQLYFEPAAMTGRNALISLYVFSSEVYDLSFSYVLYFIVLTSGGKK